LGIAGLALITFVCFELRFFEARYGLATTAFVYVILIALVSLLGSFGASVVLSIIAVACLDYFFVPPVFSLDVVSSDDIVGMAAFLTTSLVVSAVTTRLRRRENELVDAKAKLEAAQQIAHFGWWERDFTTNSVSLSDEVCRIFGLQRVDLPAWDGRWLDLIHLEDRTRVAEAAAAALLPGGPRYDVEYRVVRPDETVRAVHSQGDVTWDASGQPLRQFGVVQDITELRQAEQELRASEARFRTFVDYATDAFFLLDDQATVLDVNRQACESLGYSREELIGKHRSDLDAGLDDVSIESLKQSVVSGEVVNFETLHMRKDGTSFPVEVRVGQFDRDGRRLLCLVRDITERKRTEDELRASETRFRILVDYAIDGFFLLDINSIVLDVNRQGCQNLGYSREELIGQHRSLFDPDLDQASSAQLAQHRFTGETVTFESHHRRKDGTSFPVEVRVRAFEQGGRRFLALVRDITERKRAEHELRASEQRFRTLVQFSFDLYSWETDAQHRFIRQDLAEGLAGAEQLFTEIGKTRWEMPYLEPDADGWRKHRETLDAHQPFRDFEIVWPTPDGDRRFLSVSGMPIFDESGRFVGYHGVGRNLTEYKKAEERLRRSEAYLAEAERLNLSGAFAFNVADPERLNFSGAVASNATGSVYWSEGLYRLWWFDPLEGPPGREAWLQRVHPEDRSRAYNELQEAVHRKGEYTLEYRLVLPDGTLKYIRSIGHPSYSADGELVEVVGTTTDVTERVRAQQEHERLRQLETDLAHVNRLSIMGELTASLAHEILHPIAAARNNARAGMRFLEMSPPNLDEVRDALVCVVRDADRGRDIVSRIRDHIKKAPPREEPVDLNEAITEVIVMARNAIDRSRVSVRTCLMEQMASVRGDRVQLQQVVLNLILNAVEAMTSVEDGERELSISTGVSQGSAILVAVRDTGPGVDPEHLDRIFKPFYTTKASGIGMGLSICRSIIEAHGGELWAEGNQPRGAVFHFTLPTASQA
jgi:PAS domain S-box-containing protein